MRYRYRNLPFRPVITFLEPREEVDLSEELSVVIKRALTLVEAQAALLPYTK